MIDREKCLRFLFDRTIPMSIRGLMTDKLKACDNEIKTFQHLNFKPHKYEAELFEGAEEAHLNFINGFGVNVVRGMGGEYKYYIQRLTKEGREFQKRTYNDSVRHYDLACDTEEEVSAIMREVQKRKYCNVGTASVISAINYLSTYKTKEK